MHCKRTDTASYIRTFQCRVRFDEESSQTVTYCEHVKWLRKPEALARVKNVRRVQKLHVFYQQSVIICSMILRLISDYFWKDH
jgi:hypothetical protein